jgi:hypothetical protein
MAFCNLSGSRTGKKNSVMVRTIRSVAKSMMVRRHAWLRAAMLARGLLESVAGSCTIHAPRIRSL